MNMPTANILRYAFWGLAALEIFAESTGHRALVYWIKPLLMPTLALWLFFATQHRPPSFLRRTVLAGLGFSTAGDTLLMFAGGPSGALFFMLGLGAFLLAHVCYIGGFQSIANFKNGGLRRQPAVVLPFILFLAFFLWYLHPGIPQGMGGPVNLYAVVITTMALSAWNTKDKVDTAVFYALFSGALLFMLSDSLIAVNKFRLPFPGAGTWIMLTYLAGQYLIIRGVARFLAPQDAPPTSTH